MEVVLGPWFGQILAKSATPLLFGRLVKMLGPSPSGKGLVPISALAARAAWLAGAGSAAIEPWCTGLDKVAGSVAALQIEHAALRDLGPVDAKQHRTYVALTRIARGGSSVSPIAVKALGLLLLEAAWDARSLEAQWVEMLATLANVDRRVHPDPGWVALRQLPSLDSEALEAALASGDVNGQAARLAQRLSRALKRMRSPAALPVEGVGNGASDALANAVRETSPPAPDGQHRTKVEPTTRKDRTGKTPRPPSFVRLTSAAKFQVALDALGVPEVWHRFRLSELARVTRRLAADLQVVGSPDVAAYAACCITALLINHDHRATLELSLVDNGDLWLSVDERVLVVVINGRRRKGKGTRPNGSSLGNRFYVAIPQWLADYLGVRLRERPDARTLRELLSVEQVDEWLARCEAYLIPLGDAAHPARSARVSHSLGTAYLECGASPELAATLGVAPVLCAESSLYYVAAEFAAARDVTARVYDALGLGETAATRDFGRMGSTRALPDERVREVWASLGNAYLAALDAVRGALDLSEVAEAYTRGSAACFLAESWCTAARGQRSDQATHQDLRSYATAVYRNDKETQPDGSRLIPRLPALDQVICAQLMLSRAAADRLRALGIVDEELPGPLARPRGRDPLFGRLGVTRDAAGNAGVEWAPLDGRDVAAAVARCGCGHRNAARHTWATNTHSDGAGMWALRTLLGHGRGAAAPGSFYTTWAPLALLDDVATRMRAVMTRWALPAFAGRGDARADLLPVELRLDWLDKQAGRKHQPRGVPPLYRHMPRHYCTADSLPALRVVDEICAELRDADGFGPSGAVLASLVFMDGVTDPTDIRAIWSTLLARATGFDSGVLEWSRQGSQVIRMPLQPSTRLRLDLARTLESLDVAAEQLVSRLRAKFALVRWPATTDGILGALCWLACRWVRVHMPPLLVYCYDARTRAATYTGRSFERLQRPVDASALSMDALRRAVEPRAPQRRLDEELQLLFATVREVAHDDAPIGDDLARSQLIAKRLNERFDRLNCSAFAVMLLDWIDEEFARWTRRDTHTLQMSPACEYLRLIVRSVGRRHREWHPQDWTDATWRRFAVFVLDVTKPEEEGQVGESRRAGEIRERRKAWRRLIRVLTDSGRYMAARGAMPSDGEDDDGSTQVASASSVYCSSDHIALAERIVRALYDDSPVERDLLIALLHTGFELMGRADECNAIRLCDVGPDFVALFGEDFSTEKTDGSRRAPSSSDEFGRLLIGLRDVLVTLRPPPTHLFAQTADEIRLRHGRKREGVLVQIMRAILDDPDFLWHCFRGVGLMRRTAPGTEGSLKATLQPTFPRRAALSIVAALRGADPRHLGRVFGASGHASYLSPGQSYLAAWPLWHAAAMRSARGASVLNHRLLVLLRGRTYADAHRQRRRRSTERDEWAWVLPPEDQRTKEKRPAVVSASVSTCDLPAELKALAVRAGATWATRLRFAIEVLFGLPPGPRAWRADIGDSAARDVKEKLEPVPALGTLHHPTPGRPDDLARQRFSAVDLLNDPRSSELVAALETASAASVRALDRLLADDLRSFEVKLVEQALQALPGSWKLELCWPREQLDRDLLARLTPLRRRLIGLCDRVHVVGGIRARVVPSTGANHTSMTNLTTLTRAAVRAWLLTSTTATEE